MSFEAYVSVGSGERVVGASDYSSDMEVPVTSTSEMVRSYDVPECAQVGHVPFFASEAEAAACSQWLTVANLPWVDDAVIYLQAGWVNGLLALRFVDEDGGARYDTNDDHAGSWGLGIAHRDDAFAQLCKSDNGAINVHGLSCWCVAYYWLPEVTNGHLVGWVGHKAWSVYMYINCGMVFFRCVSSWDWHVLSAGYDAANVVPFGRLPSLQCIGCFHVKDALMTEEVAKEIDFDVWDADFLDEYAACGAAASQLVASYFSEHEYVLWTGEAYTLKCFLVLHLRRYEHCELLTHVNGTFEQGESEGEPGGDEEEPSRFGDGGGGAGDFEPDDPDEPSGGGGFGDEEEEPSGGDLSIKYGYLAGNGVSITNVVAGVRNGSPCYRAQLTIKASYLTDLLAGLSCQGEVQFNANHVFDGATSDIEMGIQSSTAEANGLAVTGELALEFAGTDGDDASTKTAAHALEYAISPDISEDQVQAVYTDTRYDSTMWLNVAPCEAPANGKFTAQKWYKISVNSEAYKVEALAAMKSELSAKVALSSATMTDHGESLQAEATGDALALTITVY